MDMELEENMKNPELPFDLLVDILLRFRLKTLCRFKIVCKAWCDLISSSVFLDAHHQRNIKFVSWCEDAKSLTFTVASRQWNEETKFFSLELEESFDVPFEKKRFSIIDYVVPVSCDLVCFSTKDINHLSDRNPSIYVCNPRTKQVCLLPKASDAHVYKLGFGYISSTREYKVVHLFCLPVKNFVGMLCETFTFGAETKISHSSWIKSKQRCPCCVYVGDSISIDGKMYWLICCNERLGSDDELIVSLDLESENFNTISRPSTWPLLDDNENIALMVMDGKLCITDREGMFQRSKLDIWMLRENCSWQQVYSMDLVGFPFGIKSADPKCIIDGDIVFMSSYTWSALYSYNIKKKKYTDVTFSRYSGLYWESLFELEGK